MTCAENVLRDHDDISAVLRVLRASAARVEQRRYVDPDMLLGLDRLLQQFVGGCHFVKERTIVFPHVRDVLPGLTEQTHACAALDDRCLAAMQTFHAVVGGVAVDGMERLIGPYAAIATRCADHLAAHLDAERPLLESMRECPGAAAHERVLEACAELERRTLGAAGREWFAQLVSDYADVAGSWSSWPATVASPRADSGRPVRPRRRSGAPPEHRRTRR